MFHLQIAAGLAAGIGYAALFGLFGAQAQGLLGAVWFLGRVFGTCLVLYPLFVCRFFGAGDIKLAALCIGFLGVEDGLFALFLGLLLAAVWLLLARRKELCARLVRLMEFAVQLNRTRCLKAYPGREDKTGLLRLGPWLFGGYCLYLLWP